jgi:predicted flavoprotein YhiN
LTSRPGPRFAGLSGLSLPVSIETGSGPRPRWPSREDLLFTHRGLSGPAVLQISSYWQEGTPMRTRTWRRIPICSAALQGPRPLAQTASPTNWPALVPSRLADAWVQRAAWGRLAAPHPEA